MGSKLFVLDLGRMRMARKSFFGDLARNDPAADELVEFPISAYLVEGPEGRILSDTGCHPDAMKADGWMVQELPRRFSLDSRPRG